MKIDLYALFDEKTPVLPVDDVSFAGGIRRRVLSRVRHDTARRRKTLALRIALISLIAALLIGGAVSAVTAWRARAQKTPEEETHTLRYTAGSEEVEIADIPANMYGGSVELPAAEEDFIPLVGFRASYLPEMSDDKLSRFRSSLLEWIRESPDKTESTEEVLRKSGLTEKEADSLYTSLSLCDYNRGFRIDVLPGSTDLSFFSIQDEVVEMHEGTFLDMQAIYWTTVKPDNVPPDDDPIAREKYEAPDKNDPFYSIRALVLVNEEYTCLIVVSGNAAAFDYGELEKIAAGLELVPSACPYKRHTVSEMDGKTWRGVIGTPGMG